MSYSYESTTAFLETSGGNQWMSNLSLEEKEVGIWYVATHLAGDIRLVYTDGPGLFFHVKGDLLLHLLYLISVWL